MKNLREEELEVEIGNILLDFTNDLATFHEAKDKLKVIFRQAMDEVIGEDNRIDPEDPDGYLISGGAKKNQLRNEQRERANKLCGKEDK